MVLAEKSNKIIVETKGFFLNQRKVLLVFKNNILFFIAKMLNYMIQS